VPYWVEWAPGRDYDPLGFLARMNEEIGRRAVEEFITATTGAGGRRRRPPAPVVARAGIALDIEALASTLHRVVDATSGRTWGLPSSRECR